MTPEVLAALRRIVDELGADAGVLLRLTPSGACLVTTSTLVPAVGEDDVWSSAGSLSDPDFRPELVLDRDRLAQLVPAGVLRALTVEPTVTLVAPVGDSALRIVLLWMSSPLPVDVTSTMESEVMRRFTSLAPLLDAQVRARESATRLRAVVGALDQAVVVTVAGDVLANINAAAARLLALQPGHVDGTTLATAMRTLRERAVDPDALGVEVARLRDSPTAVVHDWVWHLHGSPSHLRVTSAPVDNTTEQGRVWVFDDVSAEMELLESEQRANRALAESERRYRMLAENVSDVVVEGTTHGGLVWVSPSVTRTLGWAPEDLAGSFFVDLVHPDELARVMAAQPDLDAGRPVAFEVRLRTAAGGHRWMNVRVKPVFGTDGTIVGRVASWWDTQAAHEAAEQLAQTERRYQLLLENSTEVVFQTVDGVVAWVSPALEEVTGWTPATSSERQQAGVAPRRLGPRVSAMTTAPNRARTGGRCCGWSRRTGRYLWVEVVLRPYLEPDGRPGTVGMLYDVTDRVLAQEAARDSEERYRTVAENASDVVCRYGFDGTIEWVFGSTEAFLGQSAAELVGSSLEDHFMVEDWGDREAIRARLGRGEAVELLARVRRSDGNTRWVELRAKAAPGPDGSPGSIIGTMRDAHAEVEYREALAASERQARDLVDAYEAARDEAVRASTAKTAFLSRMSHELRTPLNAVLGFAQLLALDPLTPEQAEAVHHIRVGGRHLLDLINEIVDISRIEAGRLSLSMETVDSVGVLAEAVELVRPLAQQHDVVVVTAGARRGVAGVHADRQRTRQVLLNLLSNAVKYNRPGGSVRVQRRRGGPGEVCLRGHRHRPRHPAGAAAAAVRAVRPAGRGEQRRRGHRHRPGPGRRARPRDGRADRGVHHGGLGLHVHAGAARGRSPPRPGPASRSPNPMRTVTPGCTSSTSRTTRPTRP